MGDFGISTKDKWVCPNDRQLALRAKLKAGWSVKSSQLQSFTKPQQLSDFEQESIRHVIERAERIEKKEQERIGRLVEKLENMRKNAFGNGGNRCILCADDFGLLGASSLACNDCKKAVCVKCGVDTFSAYKEPLWLCKICAETREMWKKSGAWFFKGLPKYLLPEERKQDASHAAARGSGSAPKGHSRGPRGAARSSKQGRSFNTWVAGGNGANKPIRANPFENSDQETDTSSDEDGGHLGKAATLSRGRKLDSAVGSSDSLSTSPHPQSSGPSPTHLDAGSARSSVSAKEGGATTPEPTGGSGERSNSDHSIANETCNPPLRGGSASRDGLYEEDEDVDQVFSRYRRRESNASSALTRGGGGGEDDQSQRSAGEDHQQWSAGAAYESLVSQEDVSGTLEFSILYDSINNGLHCTIHRAKGLRAMDSNGLSDPYVKLHLLPGATKANNSRTKTVHKTLNPEFNETLTYYGVSENDMQKKTLRLSVLDEDAFGHDFIGEARVQLKHIRAHQTKRFNIYLDRQQNLKKDDDVLSGDRSRGKIQLSLRYSTQRQGLVVGVVRCSQLPPMDANGFSDPFAKIQLKPDPLKKRYKTSIKWKNLNPEFNEEFVFNVKLADLSKRTLEIAVWDKDYGRTNDYIGGLQLGIGSKGGRLRHWLETLTNPDHKLERWHHLGDEALSD